MPHRPPKPRPKPKGIKPPGFTPVRSQPIPAIWERAKDFAASVIQAAIKQLNANGVKSRHIRKGLRITARQLRKHQQAIKRAPNV